jgi:CBS domain-containing protein
VKLAEIPITSVMTKEVISVSHSQKLLDVKHIFEKKHFHHHIPVTSENGKLTGMISLIDFLFAIKNASLNDNEEAYHKLLVRDIMRPHPVSITTKNNLLEACNILAEGNVHALTVCEDGILKGIVSTADIIHFFIKTNGG